MKNVMNLTPEEKFNQDVWWILQEIKKEQLATPKGEKVYFPLRFLPKTSSIRRKDVDYGFPQADTQRKLLYKLKEWKALDLQPTGADLDDIFSFNPATSYFLTILKKFDELYRLYEGGGFYSENQKATTELDSSQSIIKPKSLELIAREIGDLDSGSNLVEFLTNCGAERELIEYPNTKWRMIYSVLLTLASSRNKEDKRTLFKIIEGACHPLMYGGDKNLAKKTIDKFNSFLEYDNFFIKNGVLWQGWEDPSGMMMWDDKDGNRIEPDVYLILPKKIDELYVYWNELIKLTKFYFNNKDGQDDEINDIYFEIIANVEKLLEGNGCGGLKEIYKKPFGNMIGCEFEIQKQGLTTDGLFVNLYDFLGRITELSLPDKNNVEKIKKDNSAFFTKIKQYTEQHLAKKEIIQEPPATKIEITKMPELRIKKSEKLSEKQKKQIQETALFLNQNGDLYREPKDRYCYPMGEKSNRHRIIRFLATNKGYQFTEFISTELGIESEKTIRTEIGKMRNNIEKYLKIKGKDFLQGKKESGYRINPKYKIAFKNE